jgi:hypothetical protein
MDIVYDLHAAEVSPARDLAALIQVVKRQIHGDLRERQALGYGMI